MLDKVKKNKLKSGISIPLTLIMMATSLFLMFGTAKFLEMTEMSLRLTYVALQTVQQGRVQIPSESHALESMAIVGRVNGFSDLKPTESLQKLKDGNINLVYDDSVNTNPIVRAHYTSGSSLLDGLFRGFSSATDQGISSETAESALAGGIATGATLLYADLSHSMRGRPLDYGSGEESRIKELLEAHNLPVIEGPRDSGALPPANPADADVTRIWSDSAANPLHMCWPIDISSCVAEATSGSANAAWELSQDQYTAARQCCNAARQNLPLYLGNSPIIRGRPYSPGHLLGGSGSPVQLDVDYETNRALADYNPGLTGPQNLTAANANNEFRLVCNKDIANIDPVYPNWRGYRTGDFDLRSCGAGGCPRFKNPDGTDATRFTNTQITDQDFCVLPWHYWGDWSRAAESAPWINPNLPPEIAGSGFASQLGLLALVASDFFITYKRLTEAFLIGLTEFNTNIVFSVFGGQTPFGAVRAATTDEQIITGNYVLYDGFQSSLDIEHQPIDISDNLSVQIPGAWQRMPTALDYNPGVYRTRLYAHLDQAHFPNLNPGDNSPYPFSHLWGGFEHLMSLRNPKSGREKGHAVPWGLEMAKQSPASLETLYMLHTSDWDHDTTPKDLYPNGPRNMNFVGGVAMSPQYINPDPASGFQRFKWWPLKESVAGSPSTQNLLVPKVQNFAREVFGHGFLPMMGGTALRAVAEHMKQQVVTHEASLGGLSGQPVFNIIITDGAPNEIPASQAAINEYYPSVSSLIEPAAAITDAQILDEIRADLEEAESRVKILSVLIFLQHSNLEPAAQNYIDLYNPLVNGGNYKRAVFRINYSDVQDFRNKYKQALTFVSILLKSRTRYAQ